MSSAASLRRTLLVALASLALCAPTALARAADTPTPARSGTTDDAYVLRRQFDTFHKPTSVFDAALAQERWYSSYGEPAPARIATTTAATETGDGVAWLPFALAVLGALAIGLAVGSGLHVAHARRQATRLAT